MVISQALRNADCSPYYEILLFLHKFFLAIEMD